MSCLGAKSLVCMCFIGFFVPVDLVFCCCPLFVDGTVIVRFIVVCLWSGFHVWILCVAFVGVFNW